MFYVICAYDQIWGGTNGIVDWSIWECNGEDQAISIARDNSIDIINSYSCIYEALEDDIEDNINENMTEDEIEDFRSEVYDEDIGYNIWKIKSDIVKKYNIGILEDMLNDDPEGFIKENC